MHCCTNTSALTVQWEFLQFETKIFTFSKILCLPLLCWVRCLCCPYGFSLNFFRIIRAAVLKWEQCVGVHRLLNSVMTQLWSSRSCAPIRWQSKTCTSKLNYNYHFFASWQVHKCNQRPLRVAFFNFNFFKQFLESFVSM